MASEGTISARQ